MRRAVRTLVLIPLAIAVVATAPLAGAGKPAKKLLTYEQVFGGVGAPRPAVLGPLPAIQGWQDEDHYLELRQDPADKQMKTYAVSVADGAATLQPEPAGGRGALSVPGGRWTVAPRNGTLVATDTRTRTTRQLTAIAGEVKNPRLSPNGAWVAYTRGNNLFAYDLENGVEHQYTTDGSDVILNGWSSWVYMEEILGRASNYAAFWWSPDSARLAFMRFDDSPVPVFPIYHADGQHGELERQRYPKAGDPNPYVQMGVVAVADGKLTWMDFDPKADHYIAWPFWTPDSKTLTVQWMNRGQDTLRLYNCDPASGRKTMIFEEKQKAWVEWFEDFTYLKSGSGMIIRSSVDGWEHLYLYNRDGSLKKRLTSGDWRVSAIVRVDEEGGYVYFMGKPGKTWDAQLMRVKLDGTGLETLTKGEGVHRPQLSPKAGYFVDTVSTINTPAVDEPAPHRRHAGAHAGHAEERQLRRVRLGPRRDVHHPLGGRPVPAAGVLGAAAGLRSEEHEEAVPGHLQHLQRARRRHGGQRLAVAAGALLGRARRHHHQRRPPRERALRQEGRRADAPQPGQMGDGGSHRRGEMAAHEAVRREGPDRASPAAPTAATRR